MGNLIRSAAARCDASYRFASGFGTQIGGFAATAGPVLIPTSTVTAPLLWHRGSFFAAGRLPERPEANSRGAISPTLGYRTWWDAPYAWGRPSGIVKRPRFLWIQPMYPNQSPDPALGPIPMGDWIDGVYESAFAPLNVSVANQQDFNTPPFLSGVPLSRLDTAANGAFIVTDGADTDESLYTGGDVMIVTITPSRIGFNEAGLFFPALDYTYASYGDGSEEGRHFGTPADGAVTFDGVAEAHLDVMNRAAAKCRRFGRFFYHRDVNTTPVDDFAWDGIVDGNAYITRQRFTDGDAAGLQALILADAAAFFA